MQKLKLQFKIIFLFSIFSFSFSFVANALAAKLYLEPASGEYNQGDTFIVEIKIDAEKECINAVEVNMNFSQEVLEAVNFSQGNSILTLWVKKPEINQESGLISFAGGIPGGYCGELPGEPGEIDLLGKIIFRAKEISKEQLLADVGFLESSQALLNDGFGTPTKLNRQGAVFKVFAEKKDIVENKWQEELEKDIILPELFEIEVRQDPAAFEGKYFIVFSTTDKQTGIDYYEVKEGENNWEKAESPYLLEDQDLSSIIRVRAVDKAGNARIIEYTPPKESFLYLYWKLILLILFLIGGTALLCRKRLKTTKS